MADRARTMEDMGLNRDFWIGKRILITGHTGFKGAWLCLWLQSLGAAVHGYALDPPTEPSLFQLADVGSCMAAEMRADIRDYPRFSSFLSEIQPELIIHMAAQPLVRAAYERPVETFSVNVMGTAHVLEAARHTRSVKAVIVVTTDKCYENKEWVFPYRETDRVGGRDPYSGSKACAEILTAVYRSSYCAKESGHRPDLEIASARAGNVIGGGDWADDRLIPDCIRAFSTGQPLTLRYPQAVRPWQHVLEPLSGYLLLAARLLGNQGQRFAEPWNFGPDAADAAPVGEVARSMADLWGGGELILADQAPVLHEASTLRLDTTKARTVLGWLPRWSLDRALRETAGWYKAWHLGEKMRAFTLEQIQSFEGKI